MAIPILQRSRDLKQLSSEVFDILVIGGGITGCGIARDAALRGLKIALIEKDDFASGTSSKSTKLVHGGLRYLEYGELGLVYESVNERARLMRLARHLVRPLPFLAANYRGDRRHLVTIDAGLWLYEALCFFQSYKNHRTMGPKRTLELEPALRHDDLRGSVLFYDCLTDDARLTLENAMDARELGATLVNHVAAKSLLRSSSGDIIGVSAHVADSNEHFDIRAKVIVNASGPWTDEVRSMAGETSVLKPTKGIHIVVDSRRLPTKHALMMTSPRDGRVVFCIPWGLGRTVVGTTDTFFDGSPDCVNADARDVEYLIEAANRYYPEAQIVPDDVLATWAGLRPLLKPEDSARGASALSREHMLYERTGFLTIAGGKLTTYRTMSAMVVDRALFQLGVFKRSTTKDRSIPGARGITESDTQLENLAHELERSLGDGPTARNFAEMYGTRGISVAERVRQSQMAAQRIDPELPYLMAQVDEAVENEFAVTLSDVLERRIPLILRARDQGLGAVPQVAVRMAELLQWSSASTQREIDRYRQSVNASRQFLARPLP